MLCALCISMFQGPSTEGHHHASFGDLVMAADSGCKICKYLCRFRDQIGPDDAGELNTNPFTRFCYQNDRDVPKIRFLAEVSWLEDEVPWKVIMFHTSGPKATPGWWPQFLEEINNDLLTEPWRVRGDKFPRRSIPVNTGDPEVLRLAIEWLRSCKSDHEICQKMDEACDPKYYPTRLLNIADANSQICRLCVVENGQPADGSGYVALSHCWGKDPSFLVLTSDNMDELQRGIPFSRLPKSFVDSIQTCRGLGFRYIWIDSLCIIQSGPGSEEDWQSHAATMDLIYANCELNLGVACAENAEQGAFVDRDPDFLQTAFVYMPIAMSLPDRTDTSSSYGWNSDASSTDGMNFDTSSTDETNSNNSAIVEPTTGDKESTIPDESTSQDGISRLVTIFAAHYDFQSALWELPLQQRGWVVQERFLAPRTLYFGKDRLYWECNERFQNEYLPWGLPESKNMFDGHYQRNFSIPHIVPEPTLNQLTEEDIAYLHHDWYDLVGNYSETHLTYPNKDKFVAIGAIAKKFNRLLSSQYIAGLFRSDLPLGLLWAQWKHEYLPRICEGDGWKCEDGWRELIALDSQRGSAYRAPSWSWASVDDRAHFHVPIWGGGGLRSWQESRKTIATVVSIRVKVVDKRNPYGQLSSAEITIEGSVTNLRSLDQACILENPQHERVERKIERYDDTDQLVALHIFEVNRFKNNGAVCPYVYGLVLSPSGMNTFRRVGFYECRGPIGSRYSASHFKRATVTIV